MSDTSQAENFTERVDISTQSDRAFIGRLEIDVRGADDHQDRIAALQSENTALRAEVLTLPNRIAESLSRHRRPHLKSESDYRAVPHCAGSL